MFTKVRSAKAAGIAVGALALMGGTAAAANSGSLPDPVQDVAHDVAGAVGVDVPDSHGLSDTVHEIIADTETGRERGEKISQAAHDRNEARKAAKGDDTEGDDEAGHGKSADAHDKAAEKKAQHEGDDADEADDDAETDDVEAPAPADQANPNATEGADNADDGAGNAADQATEHVEDAQANRP